MNIFQQSITSPSEIESLNLGFEPDLFLLFVSPDFKEPEAAAKALAAKYPKAKMMGCSTAGEILGDKVFDESMALTAVHFEKTGVELAIARLEDTGNSSFDAGAELGKQLNKEDLQHLIVLSDGIHVNGAELVKGLHANLPKTVGITGGLAGDNADFGKTFTIANGELATHEIVGVGLYGADLKIGFGSRGGWDSFGMERLVTKAVDNVLYELDGQPALELYKSFLGDKASELPGSGLLFPLSMRSEDNDQPVVRTILGISEEDQSLTFAGTIYEGSYVRLMKANVDRLIDGAEDSAKVTKTVGDDSCQLALLVSCVGRRLVLKQLVEEEVEVVNEVLGENVKTTGFYSYGEIAPFDKFTACSLHNQTMTITTLSE